MLYALPKKIQLTPSQAKWSIQSPRSVLILLNLNALEQLSGWAESDLAVHLQRLLKKAQALEIPVLSINSDQPEKGLMALGQYLAADSQLVLAGQMDGLFNQVLRHVHSVTEQVCVVDDAVLASSVEQHIQWIDSMSQQQIHHINTYSLTRLWSLSAPAEQILSKKGILLAVAEQVDLHPMEIDLATDLREYGLDSVAMVTLIGLWRANGANISYEDFLQHPTLQALLQQLSLHPQR